MFLHPIPLPLLVWDLRSGRQRRYGEGGRRDATKQQGDFIVDDEFLRESLADIRYAGVVLEDNFNLLAGDRVAVLLHVEPHARQPVKTAA